MVRKLLLFLVGLLWTTAWGAGGVEIAVELTVPDATWAIRIDEVRRVGDELWAVSTVSRDPEVMGAQVISTVRNVSTTLRHGPSQFSELPHRSPPVEAG